MEFLLQNGWYILLIGAMGYMMFKGGGCCGGHSHGGRNNEVHGHGSHGMKDNNQVEMAIDPVCGMYVNPETALQQSLNGTVYYFCSESCRKSFVENHK